MALGLNDVDVDGMKELDRKVRENPALGKRTVKLRSTWQRGVKALVEIGAQEILGKAATSEEQVRRCKETIDRKSPVADTLANGVKITSTFVHKPS